MDYDKKAENNSNPINKRTHAFVQEIYKRVKMLQNKIQWHKYFFYFQTADIALCDISFTEERFSMVDFTVPTFHNDIAFISHSPSISSSSVNLIIDQPFERAIWLAIVTTFVALLFALKLLSFSRHNSRLQLYNLTIGLLAIALKQRKSTTFLFFSFYFVF